MDADDARRLVAAAGLFSLALLVASCRPAPKPPQGPVAEPAAVVVAPTAPAQAPQPASEPTPAAPDSPAAETRDAPAPVAPGAEAPPVLAAAPSAAPAPAAPIPAPARADVPAIAAKPGTAASSAAPSSAASSAAPSAAPAAPAAAASPYLRILRPLEPSFYGTEIRIEGRVSDSQRERTVTAVERLTYAVREYPGVSGEVFYSFADGGFRVVIPTAKIRGKVTVDVRAVRKEGTATAATVIFYDGTVRPALQVDSPADGSKVGSRILVAGRAWDPSPDEGQPRGIRSLACELRSSDDLAAPAAFAGELALDGSGNFHEVLDAGKLPGRHELVVTVEAVSGSRLTRRIAIERARSAIPSFAADSGEGVATLRWEPVPLAEDYTLGWAAGGGDPTAAGAAAIRGVRSPFTMRGLENGVRYRFALRADLGADSASAPEWSHVVEAMPLAPATLTPAVVGEYRQIRVRWPRIAGAAEYEVFRSLSAEGPWLSIGRAASTELLDRRVRTGETYYYRVAPAVPGSLKSDAACAAPLAIPSDRLVPLGFAAVTGARALAVLGDYAIVAEAGSLAVVDIFNMAEPVVAARLALEAPASVAVRDTWAYVAEPGRGLKVVDLSNPAAPRLTSSRNLPDAEAVVVSGGPRPHVYVAAGDDGVLVLDAANPGEPVPVGRGPSGSCCALALAPAARLLAAGPEGLALFDLTEPSVPRLLSRLPLERARSVTAGLRPDGREIAYVATAEALNLVDVSDPAAPVLVTSVALDDPRQIQVRAEPDGRVFAYVADGTRGTKVVDVSDPATPQVFGDLASAPADAIALRDDFCGRAYALTVGPSGLSILDVFTQGRSLEVAAARTGTEARALALGSLAGVGRVVAVADGGAGIRLFGAADPAALSESSLIASIDTADACDVRLAAGSGGPGGERIFAAERGRGVRVIGIEREGGGVRLRSLLGLETGGDARAIDTQERDGRLLVYAADALAGLTIFDVTDPASARRLASVSLGGARDVAVRAGLAVVALGAAGVEVLDVTDAAAPRSRGRIGSLYARTASLATLDCGTTVAAFTGPEGLSLFDMTDPGAPRRLALYPSRDAEDAIVSAERAYLAEGVRGLSVLDLSVPGSPRRVSSADVEYAAAVAVAGEHAFVVDHRGVRVLRVIVPQWLAARSPQAARAGRRPGGDGPGAGGTP